MAVVGPRLSLLNTTTLSPQDDGICGFDNLVEIRETAFPLAITNIRVCI